MKSKQFDKRLIVSIILVYYCQQSTAARMIKGSKPKNITNLTLEVNRAADENKTTTTTAVTNKPEQDITAFPADFEVNARHAFINNQFVAEDEEPITSTAATSYQHLQHSYNINEMNYDQQTIHIKEPLSSDSSLTQKLPLKPILSYGKDQLDDYEDEETSDYASENESTPENCEDTQESLLDNNDKDEQNQFTQEQEVVHNGAPLSYENKLYDTYGNNNFGQNTNIRPALLYASKPVTKPLAQHLYDQTYTDNKDLQHSAQLQKYSFVKSKPIYIQDPNYNAAETSQLSLSYENPLNIQQKAESYNKPQYSLYGRLNLSNNATEVLNLPGNLNNMNTSFMPNFSYGNANKQTTSPFSTTSGSNKRFKTVSSSIQYVSTPLVDLVFKYSIGVAKHSNSKIIKNVSDHHENVSELRNNINDKTK